MNNVTPVVIDNGSGWIKGGYGGDDQPHGHHRPCVFPSVVGYGPDHPYNEDVRSYIGDEAVHKRKILISYKHPIERGLCKDWNDMEKIWHHTFYNELRIAPEEHPILMSQAIHNPFDNQTKTAQIMFETYNVPAMYLAFDNVLSLFTTGRINGISLMSGYGKTNIVPVYQGNVLKHAAKTLDVAGKDLTNYLYKLLKHRGYNFTTMTQEIVRDIKERLGYIAIDYEDELKIYQHSTDMKQKYKYKLPDGQMIYIGNEIFQCFEPLFKPKLIGVDSVGIDTLIYESIMECDDDLRKQLYGNIVLSGGSTMVNKIENRIQKEINTLCTQYKKQDIVIPDEQDRKYNVWIGGSIFSTLSWMEDLWIHKAHYDEYSDFRIVHGCF